jgi:hypothetical protein|nr:MAG TPA: hypothetical protein [Caudoviricetes sp.]
MLYVPILKLSSFVLVYILIYDKFLRDVLANYHTEYSILGGFLFFILMIYLNNKLEEEENSKMFGTLYTNENGEVVASEIYRRQQENRR